MADEAGQDKTTVTAQDGGDRSKERSSSPANSSFRPRNAGGQQRQGQGGYRGSGGGGGFRGGRGGFRSRRKVCSFCVDKVKTIDWKSPNSMRRFIGEGGSIRARRKTGTCAKHQRRLAIAIKRARQMALLPFTNEHVRLSNKN